MASHLSARRSGGRRPSGPAYQPMPPRLRTLPDRHGGRVVLGLLIAVLVLGLALRLQAALTPPQTPATTPRPTCRSPKGLYEDGHYGGPGAGEPERLVAGRAAALRSGLPPHRGRAPEGGAAAARAAGDGHDPAHLPARPPARRPGGGTRRRAAGRDLSGVHREHRPHAGRAGGAVLAAGGDARVPVGVRRRAPVALAGARRTARADHAHPPRVPAVRGRSSRCWPCCGWRGATRAAAAPACCPVRPPVRCWSRRSAACWRPGPPAT